LGFLKSLSEDALGHARWFGLALSGLLALAGGTAWGAVIVVDREMPSIDRWVYPFNQTRGYRAAISTFSSLGQENAFPPFSFDQRDAQMLIGFETDADVPIGRGACGYRVTGATVVLTVSEPDAFRYDATVDDWTSYLAGADDADGRPIELFGAAFRAPWTAETYFEGSELDPGPEFGPSGATSDSRYAYATDFAGGVERDVSNNVRDEFNPIVFAVGRNETLFQGQFVPIDTELTFDLDVENETVQAYLRNAVNSGRLRLMVTALQPAASGGGAGSGEYATFYAKEIDIEGLAARLSMAVVLLPHGDADGSSVVDFDDIVAVLAAWGATGLPGINGDADCSGVVDFDDIVAVLGNWGAVGP